LNATELPKLDMEFEEITEDEDLMKKQRVVMAGSAKGGPEWQKHIGNKN